jgi:thioredoxin 1
MAELADSDFDALIRAKGIVLIDFFAPWCGPCRAFEPIFLELAREFQGIATLEKVNIDSSPALAERYAVRSIPTLIFFKDGIAVETFVGARTREDVAKRLRTLIQS